MPQGQVQVNPKEFHSPTVVGFATLPAATHRAGPPTGQFVQHEIALPSVPLPIFHQPIQGLSGAFFEADGSLTALSDNGFGQKINSADYELCVYRLAVNPRLESGGTGSATVLKTIKLTDPKRLAGQMVVADLEFYPGRASDATSAKVPVPEAIRDERILTGADFDPESIRRASDGTLWVGEEFGPFLLHFSSDGELLEAPIQIPVPAELQQFARGNAHFISPDHPQLATLETDAERFARANIKRSKGLEGLALSVDGKKLYPLLEGPLVEDPNQRRLVICEYLIEERRFSGRYWFYELERSLKPSPSLIPENTKIGCCTAMPSGSLAILETDDGQGSASWCKRVYEIDLSEAATGATLSKKLLVDLLKLADPDGISSTFGLGAGAEKDTLRLDQFCIESLVFLDSQTLLVVNDNNFGTIHGSSRVPGEPDQNEFCFIRLPRRSE